jgi:hypothetical protein
MENSNMTLKEGTDISKLHPKLLQILKIADQLWPLIYPEDSSGLTVTSGHEGTASDGIHSPNSKHYLQNCNSAFGEALDLRANDVVQAKLILFASTLDLIAHRIHNIPVKIFLENMLKDTCHIHIQLGN